MPKSFAYADLIPKNPAAPFDNPTEEPDYTPDYREIAPELDMPQAHLPLFPTDTEPACEEHPARHVRGRGRRRYGRDFEVSEVDHERETVYPGGG